MMSSSDIERLIAVKRREIEKEKTLLGLSPPPRDAVLENVKENTETSEEINKEVSFADQRVLCQRNDFSEVQEEKALPDTTSTEPDDIIPPDLERYIRRYIGLPVMLKAGEYSPNNPLVRAERHTGNALLGLGEYERRRNTLRKIRQQQYREYLDQQAKKKQEAKEQAERERREREQKEKERDEREKQILEERERYSAERRRCVQHVSDTTGFSHNKVDTAVQVDGFSCPLSVAVQTEDREMFRPSPSATKSHLTLTEAERELSPRSVNEAARAWPPEHWTSNTQRRKSYGDYDERTSTLMKKCSRDKLSDLRHTYMPSIFDADAIRLRNMEAEKEAAERRQFYQQELKNQIKEQQRIREERKNREKMLELAEMRRLEEQLRMLRVAQEREIGKQQEIAKAMKDSADDYNMKRTELQREIDTEQRNLRAASNPSMSQNQIQRNTNTARSETTNTKLPFYYPRVTERTNEICDKKPFSINIPEDSIFSANYDVDSYLRRNLNFISKGNVTKTYEKENESVNSMKKENESVNILNREKVNKTYEKDDDNVNFNRGNVTKMYDKDDDSVITELKKNVVVEKALIHDRPEDRLKDRPKKEKVKENEPSFNKNVENDTLPIPVLRHSPRRMKDQTDDSKMSEAMKKVDDKWKVPVVQKNILKAMPNEEGKSVNILTQLGSIRRQLQLEQLKLDKMNSKEDDV